MGAYEKYFSTWFILYPKQHRPHQASDSITAVDMQQQLKKPIVLHNRYWATDNDYPQYKFAEGTYEALPLEVCNHLILTANQTNYHSHRFGMRYLRMSRNGD